MVLLVAILNIIYYICHINSFIKNYFDSQLKNIYYGSNESNLSREGTR